MNSRLQKTYISVSKPEINLYIAKLAYEIDNEFYNIPHPQEKPEENKTLLFEEFKQKNLLFKQLFESSIKKNGISDIYDDRRIEECHNLLNKLSVNISILETHEIFWERMPNEWNLIRGTNKELDYFIDENINKQLE